MNKHFKLLFPSKIPANRQHATLTSITSANVAQIAATKIEKLAHIRMKFGGIMQTVGNER